LDNNRISPLSPRLTALPGAMPLTKSNNMGDALDKRMPVNELYVTAAILDPAQRQLSTVSKFLEQRNQTAVDLVTQCVDRFAGSALEYQASGAGDPVSVQYRRNSPPWKKTKI
jgi:predicted ATPase